MCSLKEPAPLPSPIVLGEATTFKLTFTIVDTASGEPVFPQQAHLLFADTKGEEDVTLPVSVKSNGKASFTIVSAACGASLWWTGPLGLRIPM
jgi:oligosaccharyltransferase complex subunit delta (ribophorin II)